MLLPSLLSSKLWSRKLTQEPITESTVRSTRPVSLSSRRPASTSALVTPCESCTSCLFRRLRLRVRMRMILWLEIKVASCIIYDSLVVLHCIYTLLAFLATLWFMQQFSSKEHMITKGCTNQEKSCWFLSVENVSKGLSKGRLLKYLCCSSCRILSCLMEHLYTEKMVDDCEHRLLELQYFIARDWK